MDDLFESFPAANSRTRDRLRVAIAEEGVNHGGTAVQRRLSAPGAAVGRSIAQYGEILQGQLETVNGAGARRFLVSLPCDLLYSEVTFRPSDDDVISVYPPHKTKVAIAVELTLRRLGRGGTAGSVTVESNIIEGKGCGSSTADCVAAVRATAAAFGIVLSDGTVARLVVDAEHASDNFMFGSVVVFAHRLGVVIEELGPALPRLNVLGLDTDRDGAVHTLDFPPAEYTSVQKRAFGELVSALRHAVLYQDCRLLGKVATASATINQAFLPKPMFAEIRAIAEEADALGLTVAHSGTVMSILLSSADVRLEARVETIIRRLEELGVRDVARFRT